MMKEHGFTLIELLIAMTILSILVVIVFGGFRIGVKAWEKGDAQAEAVQRKRLVLDLFKRQVASAREMIEPEKMVGDEQMFHGEEEIFQFLTGISICQNENNKKILVKYTIRRDGNGEKLYVRETDASMIGLSEKMDIDIEDEDHLLLDGEDEIKFEYLDADITSGKDIEQWATKWDLTQKRKYPDAVRLSIRQKKVGHEYRVVGRMICD